MHRTCMANPRLTKACDGCSWDKEVLFKSCFNWPQPLACDRTKSFNKGNYLSQYAMSRTPETVDDLKHTWTPLETMLLGTVNPSHVPEGCQEPHYNLKPAWQIKANTCKCMINHGKSTIDKCMQWLLLGQRGIASKVASTGLNLLLVTGTTSITKYLGPVLSQYAMSRTPETVDDPEHTWTPLRTMLLGTVNPSHVPEGCQASQMHGKSTIDKSMQLLLLGQRGIAQKLLQLASTSCVWQEQNPSTKCAGPTYLRMPLQGHLRLWMTWNTLGHHFEPRSLEQSTQVTCLKGVKTHSTT